MNFTVAPDSFQKLALLDGALRFEPAGSNPAQETGSAAATAGGVTRAPKPLPCISMVSTPTGQKPILKSMMTTACERNCYYCPFRAGRTKTKRITFSAEEMASTFDQMQRRRQVDGLFLSSGIVKGGVTTQDKILETAEILRHKYRYKGYIHLKIMPGAEREQIRRTMQLANRVSINLEAPTEERLKKLAPQKDYWAELFERINWISEFRRHEQLLAGVVTQFVVGAVGDTDLELLSLTEKLYGQLDLKRSYYSAFHPVAQTPLENIKSTPLQREFRLYQSSYLLRDYGWDLEDFAFDENANLPLNVDPKRAWAEIHLKDAPVEVNSASRRELLRVPGIGPKTAELIVRSRRLGRLTELEHLKRLGLRRAEMASSFILLDGRRPARQLSLF